MVASADFAPPFARVGGRRSNHALVGRRRVCALTPQFCRKSGASDRHLCRPSRHLPSRAEDRGISGQRPFTFRVFCKEYESCPPLPAGKFHTPSLLNGTTGSVV